MVSIGDDPLVHLGVRTHSGRDYGTDTARPRHDHACHPMRYHYETHGQLREHLGAFLDAYNFAKRLKTLRGLTPFETICKVWAGEPHLFTREPIHLTSGLNVYS